MGYLFSGRCYASQDEVVDAYFSSSPPQFAGGETLYLYEFTKTDAWRMTSWQIGPQGGTTKRYEILAKVPQFSTCDPGNTDYSDWSSQTVLFLLALFFAAFLGFRTGFRP